MSKQGIIDKAKSESRTLLTEIESKELLKQAGLSIIDTRLATSAREAVAASQQLGFPVVLKIASPDIAHKTDAGGVRLGLKTASQVGKAYREIMSATRQSYPRSRVHGEAVQKMARPGAEGIVGMSRDAQFGPVLMFGLGGVWVEIIKDVSFRIAPLTRRDAREMITEIKAFPLLNGYRGQEPADITALEDFLLGVSRFVELNPEVKELDLNPIFAYKDGAVAVDARIIIEDGLGGGDKG